MGLHRLFQCWCRACHVAEQCSNGWQCTPPTTSDTVLWSTGTAIDPAAGPPLTAVVLPQRPPDAVTSDPTVTVPATLATSGVQMSLAPLQCTRTGQTAENQPFPGVAQRNTTTPHPRQDTEWMTERGIRAAQKTTIAPATAKSAWSSRPPGLMSTLCEDYSATHAAISMIIIWPIEPINKTVFGLSQCIGATSHSDKRIPFRKSNTTRILSLDQNNGIAVMLPTWRPHVTTISAPQATSTEAAALGASTWGRSNTEVVPT
ncbi:hypothetical protein CONLIGDRAFT_685781 [Coniochaeta ligniaria NRRL 30616]|uniref:Uncharacterized protein n=1 Tax=Coniochaeta ligniaria NRRL 30616 TaxID=1408157 RepID=A0A1J7I9L6_9PEZI|nr:hypothetical protein CONLIGDRAFT_685781 [Coniochaeta ligniaria NRRL 30616]